MANNIVKDVNKVTLQGKIVEINANIDSTIVKLSIVDPLDKRGKENEMYPVIHFYGTSVRQLAKFQVRDHVKIECSYLYKSKRIGEKIHYEKCLSASSIEQTHRRLEAYGLYKGDYEPNKNEAIFIGTFNSKKETSNGGLLVKMTTKTSKNNTLSLDFMCYAKYQKDAIEEAKKGDQIAVVGYVKVKDNEATEYSQTINVSTIHLLKESDTKKKELPIVSVYRNETIK